MENKDKNLCFDNREFSWLKFNERVLEEAQKESGNPILERLKFISIFTSNLDEFFMVRVGTLTDYQKYFKEYVDSRTNLTLQEQLSEIYRRSTELYIKCDEVYGEVLEDLKEKGIKIIKTDELDEEKKKKILKYYKKNILPILSPQIIDVWHPFPFLQNKKLYVTVELEKKKEKKLVGIIPVPVKISRLLEVEGMENTFLLLEDIIEYFCKDIFSMYKVLDSTVISITRNADIDTDYDMSFDENADYRQFMKKLIKNRSKLAPVRLEFQKEMSKFFTRYFLKSFNLEDEQLFISKAPLDLSFTFTLENIIKVENKEELLFSIFKPKENLEINKNLNIANLLFEKDLLLFYPFESMKPFLNLLKQASEDERVESIKITLYRISKDSKLANYLISAAENGKDVTILMELRARFDEENNIEWAKKFQEAGCRVIYGADKYKVHSKICQITYKTEEGFKYITQVGTGNYNEKTTKIYTDFSIITSDKEIGVDADKFFKNMAVNNLDGKYEKLWVAPTSFKQNVLKGIEEEIEKSKRGEKGIVTIKCNSFTDKEVMKALIVASKNNVDINLIVRGICCIIPKVEGLTENIKVVSIVGRFLEHSRIYSFGQGDEQKLYISSGDMMTRNTENRVEICCPIEDRIIKQKINSIIDIILKDNVKSRELEKDRVYRYRHIGEIPINSQEIFMEESETF